ncbi:hypothetical protein LTR62_007163 [Meristemomyces frigidus]|uniref:Uncharacterized protein n=1 Tax=Meristemomyces frigidus TaxID=1508187 RepID=A0AAN7TJ69_9PEZI|nr:hypothetical protein LTR62_007163 [Meristemomyces frigidus]
MANAHHEPNHASSSLFVPHDDHYDNEHASRRPRLALPPMRSTPPARFVGDGLDFRRPIFSGVTSAARDNTVIDLTEEDRGQADASWNTGLREPRFQIGGRSIINLDELVDEEPLELEDEGMAHGHILRQQARVMDNDRPRYSLLRRVGGAPHYTEDPTAGDENGDLEILSERSLRRPQTMSRDITPRFMDWRQRSSTPFPGNPPAPPQQAPIDLTEDDDVVFMSENQREGGGVNATAPGTTAGLGTRTAAPERTGFGGLADMLRGNSRLMRYLGEPEPNELFNPFRLAAPPHLQHRYNHRPHIDHVVPPAAMPNFMDYETAAFGMGLEAPPRPPSPKYAAPPFPGSGFTRNPSEDEEVVCPNCGDELAVGENKLKQEVWVLRACGHAYCGTCAINRGKKSSKKGKARVSEEVESRPFAKCQVEGCGKACKSASSMIHVFLGS